MTVAHKGMTTRKRGMGWFGRLTTAAVPLCLAGVGRSQDDELDRPEGTKRNLILQFLLLLLPFAAASPCSANIIYNVDLAVGAGTATGFIETDGTIGDLGASHILDWNLSSSDGTNAFDFLGPLSGNNSAGSVVPGQPGGDDLLATPTKLLYNFTSSPNAVYFASPGNIDVLCFAAEPCAASGVPNGETLRIGASAVPQNTPLSGLQAVANAESTSVPEPSSLALLGAGIAIMWSEKRRRRNRFSNQACHQMSQLSTASNWNAERRFLTVLS